MKLSWPRGWAGGLKYLIFRPFGIRIYIARNTGAIKGGRFMDQMGMPFEFVMSCTHNHFAWRELRVHFRHVEVSIAVGKARQLYPDQCGGTGYWRWPQETLKSRLYFMFDRCWYNSKNDFGRDYAKQGMEAISGRKSNREVDQVQVDLEECLKRAEAFQWQEKKRYAELCTELLDVQLRPWDIGYGMVYCTMINLSDPPLSMAKGTTEQIVARYGKYVQKEFESALLKLLSKEES